MLCGYTMQDSDNINAIVVLSLKQNKFKTQIISLPHFGERRPKDAKLEMQSSLSNS